VTDIEPDSIGHALAVGLTLITNDIAEFRRVPGLNCEDWTR
jgi:predicted nucleic acid-binding protein